MAQHTNKKAQTQAVTADRLLDGAVVYLTDAGSWSEWVNDAAVANGKDAAAALLDRALPDVEKRLIIEPYLFEVDPSAGDIRPVSVREQIRMAGPTVRLDLGKQATAQAA